MKKEKYELRAQVTDEYVERIEKGEILSNNGLRSPNGNYYPDQPDFELVKVDEPDDEPDDEQDALKEFAVDTIIEGLKLALIYLGYKGATKVWPWAKEKIKGIKEHSCKNNEEPVIEAEAKEEVINELEIDENRKEADVIYIEDYKKAQ